MQDDIKKYGSVRPSSMAATAADALLAIGVLPTSFGSRLRDRRDDLNAYSLEIGQNGNI